MDYLTDLVSKLNNQQCFDLLNILHKKFSKIGYPCYVSADETFHAGFDTELILPTLLKYSTMSEKQAVGFMNALGKEQRKINIVPHGLPLNTLVEYFKSAGLELSFPRCAEFSYE